MPSRLHSLLVAGLLAPTDSFSAHPPATYGGATTHIATTLLRRRAAATPTCQFAEGGQFAEAIEAFAPRDTLLEVRAQRVKLQAELAAAVADEDFVTAAMLRDDLAELQQKDPAFMAELLRAEMAKHVQRERFAEAARCRDDLMVLRRFLPQFQLAGLWKGNYPNHGDELVRIQYRGDMLFATKITGDEHVPKGEITFQADLAASSDASGDRGSSSRSPIGGDDASGVRVEVVSVSTDGKNEPKEVEQFRGEGRIAARGFRHPHFVPGRLFLMDDDVIGFLWMPIGTFVVFSRVPENDEPSTKAAVAAVEALDLDALAEAMHDGRQDGDGDDDGIIIT